MLDFLLKLTLVWAAFALIYSTLLRRETFFRANRIYLLAAAAAGLVLPFAHFFFPGKPFGAAAGGASVLLPEIVVRLAEAGKLGLEIPRGFFGAKFLAWAWGAGTVLAGLRFAAGLWQVFSLALGNRAERQPDGTLLFRLGKPVLPFSFFRWIFVGKDFDAQPGAAQMLAHERAHARGLHSADVLFFEVLCIAFWFHPLAWWFKRAARVTHEYLADAHAARLTDRKQYGFLLLRQTPVVPALALANHFFSSQLKNRIVMLTKKASRPEAAGLKYGLAALLLPLFGVVFQQNPVFAQSTPDAENLKKVRAIEANGWLSLEADTVITFDPKTYEETVKIVRGDFSPKPNTSGQLVYEICELLPEFPGGQVALMKFLGENTKYPAASKARKSEGRVVVEFTVMNTGQVTGAELVQNETQDADLIAEALRVVKSLPNFKPGIHGGQPVNCRFKLPIKFSLK